MALPLRQKSVRFAILALLVALVSAGVIFPQTHKADWKDGSFSADEPGWIAASYYYTELVESGDFTWERWDCPECGAGSSYGSLNMHLGEWLIGLPLVLDSHTRSRPFRGYYDVNATFGENVRSGLVPPFDTLLRARTAPAVFGVLCCVCAFAIGFWTYNAVIGLITAGLMLLNPLFLKISGQVMTDTFYNFFLLSGCLALVVLYKTRQAKQALWVVAAAGVLTGLACSVKVTGLLAAGSVFAVAAGWRFYVRRAGRREILSELLLFTAVSLTVIYLLNPLFWPSLRKLHPVAAAREAQSIVSQVAATRHIPWHRREEFLTDDRYPQMKNLSHVLEFPLLFPRWSNMMERQLSRGWANWDGPRLFSLNRTLVQLALPALGSGAPNRWADRWWATAFGFFLALLVFGVGAAVALRNRASFPGSAHARLVPVLYFAVNYLFISSAMKLNWDRYYLPTILAAQLLAAVGIYCIGERAYILAADRLAFPKGRQRMSLLPFRQTDVLDADVRHAPNVHHANVK